VLFQPTRHTIVRTTFLFHKVHQLFSCEAFQIVESFPPGNYSQTLQTLQQLACTSLHTDQPVTCSHQYWILEDRNKKKKKKKKENKTRIRTTRVTPQSRGEATHLRLVPPTKRTVQKKKEHSTHQSSFYLASMLHPKTKHYTTIRKKNFF
jgi:hypothetical protein